jgi:hypothetical protein
MEKYEVNKILDLYHSKEYSKKIVIQDLPLNKLSYWVALADLKDFDFVRDIINKELQNIDKGFRCSDIITLLIYEKGDFFTEHSDKIYASGILSGGYLLNDEYKGGNFIVDGKKLEVGVGELFTYGREILHEVTEVTDGVRYSLHFVIVKP